MNACIFEKVAALLTPVADKVEMRANIGNRVFQRESSENKRMPLQDVILKIQNDRGCIYLRFHTSSDYSNGSKSLICCTVKKCKTSFFTVHCNNDTAASSHSAANQGKLYSDTTAGRRIISNPSNQQCEKDSDPLL